MCASFGSPDGAGSYKYVRTHRVSVGGGSVPRSRSPDGVGFYRMAPQGPLLRAKKFTAKLRYCSREIG